MPFPDLEHLGPLSVATARSSGHRVVVVIDDCAHMVAQPEPGINGQGLLPIYHAVTSWEDTRAVGFFFMPAEEREVDDILLPRLKAWLDDVSNADCNIYCLVDWHHGTTGIGPYVYACICDVLPTATVGFLSYAGDGFDEIAKRVLIHPKVAAADFFLKSEVQLYPRAKGLEPHLAKWLGRHAHPLDRLWDIAEAEGWFGDRAVVMLHEEAEAFNRRDPYAATLQRSLGFALPAKWFDSARSFTNLHEAVKSLCGMTFAGSASTREPRNVTVGSTYLIAILASYYANTNLSLLSATADWACFAHAKSLVFPNQTPLDAKASARALYDLMYLCFVQRLDDALDPRPPIGATLLHRGAYLEIDLPWRPDEVQTFADRFKGRLASAIPEEGELLAGDGPKCVPAALRLWRKMGIASDGVMPPGSVSIRAGKLLISGARS